MKLEVGMLVRTKQGTIEKIIDKYEAPYGYKVIVNEELRFKHYEHNYIKHISKASHSIIDLIEVGDYINGEKVTSIESNGWLGFGNHDLYLSNEEEIETVVTKEMFFNAEYRVETD